MVVERGRSGLRFKSMTTGPSRARRRHASTDSEEDARPLKKAPSHARPSYAGLDDPDYEAELHDEELVPVRSTTKSKKKQAAGASSSKSAAPSGLVLSMANPTNRGRRTINYQSMDPSEYAALRSDVNQFAAPANATDPRFRTFVQQDIYQSVIAHLGFSPQHYVNLDYIENNPTKFDGVLEKIEGMGLRRAMTLHCDWNEAAIRQFYATCFFHPDRSITWMTHHSQFTVSFEAFAAALGMPGSEASLFRIHEVNPKFEAMPISACGCLVMPTSQLSTVQQSKELNDISIFRLKYRWLFQCILNSIAPKKGDRGMVRAYSIDLMYYSRKNPTRPIDMADFLWHEIRMASCLKVRTLPHAPFIQTVIDSVFTCPINKTNIHSMWTPRDDTSRGKAPAPSCGESSSRHTKPFIRPFDRLARFIGKSHKAIFDTCRYTATHIATEEVRRISEANALRARLRACPGSPVEPDEPIPDRLPLPEVDFPSATDFPEFFLAPADLSDGDDDDDEDAE